MTGQISEYLELSLLPLVAEHENKEETRKQRIPPELDH